MNMNMFAGTRFEPVLKEIMQDVEELNRAEGTYVIAPEEQWVIDNAILVRSRIVEVGLTQGQFDRAEGKKFWTKRLHKKFGVLSTLAYHADRFGRLVVDTPTVTLPSHPDVKYSASLSDSFPDVWCEQEDAPWTNSMWFELGMFTRSAVKIYSRNDGAEESRPEFWLAAPERPRVRDSSSSWGITRDEEGVRMPYYVSPERLQVASAVLDLVTTSLQSARS